MQVIRNVGRADEVISFIENLTITIGEDAGKKFKLRPFQKDFISDIYEPADGSKPTKRLVRRAVLSVARKNGKSELAAALILVHLIGPESEPNGEIYSAANDREQAAIVFRAVVRMVEADPRLQQIITIARATKTMFVRRSDLRCAGSKFQALSAEAGTKHGLNPSFIIYDELAQAKTRELLDTLTTSQGARSEPLFLTISTQSHDPNHPLTEMIEDGLRGEDPTMVAHLHAANDDCDLLDEAEWLKANPALGDFRSLDELRIMAHRAVRLPSEEQAFRLLYLNQRVSIHASLIAPADWKACAPAVADYATYKEADSRQFAPKEDIYLGLDMSMATDLTALVRVSAGPTSYVKADFWKPEDRLQEHSDRDRFRYDLMVKHGWMRTAPGRMIDPAFIAHRIKELTETYNVRGLAYDPAYMGELLRCLAAIGVTTDETDGHGLRMVKWQQGFISMGQAVNAFERTVVNSTGGQRELQHDGNPVLTWNVMNAVTLGDPAGNRKFDKTKARFRIDGAVALAMALGLKSQDGPEQKPHNPWEDESFSLLKMFA